jgi:GT2 family glycosyltransferase
MLLAQDFDDYEVIVVDQTPHYPVEVQRRLDSLIGTRIRYYKLPHPNVSRARNLGIRAAQAEIVNFLDDDVILERDYLKLHYLNFMDPDKKIGAVTGLIWEREYKSAQDSLNMMKARLAAKGELKLGDTALVGWLTTCNVSYLRKALFEVGMFDEYLHTFCEDVDLSLRVRHGGYRLLLDTKIIVFHLVSPEGGSRSIYRDERKKEENISAYSYCMLKNLHSYGVWSTLRVLFRQYRRYILCRPILKNGLLRECLRRNLTYIRLLKKVITDLKKRNRRSQEALSLK